MRRKRGRKRGRIDRSLNGCYCIRLMSPENEYDNPRQSKAMNGLEREKDTTDMGCR